MNQEEENGIGLTEFDYQLADPNLQMIKAAIPYIPAPQQRVISLLIRIQEMRRTIEMFSGNEVSAMGLHPAGNHTSSPTEMLQAMKPYAGPRERDFIEMLENIQIMLQAMQTPG